MRLAAWLRDLVWLADDWRAALAATVAPAGKPGRGVELGQALELIEPDRRAALRVYRAVGAHADALRIAREIGAHEIIAELALEEHERSGDAAALIAAANAWIDAGEAARAVRPLAIAARTVRDERLSRLGAACLGELDDPRNEVGRQFERARAADDVAGGLAAIRLARACALPEEQLFKVLRAAFEHWPGDDGVAAQLEAFLLARGDPDELLVFYKQRLATKPEARAWADEVRAISSRLCVRGIAPGLGLRLARKGLEHAYDADVHEIPGHLATWAMLVEHARKVRATRELMPLAVHALRVSLPDDDRLWLARLGLGVAWRDAADADAATAFAAVVIELAPDHPDVRDFVDAQDIDVDIDVEMDASGSHAVPELALSLVYLDEHGGRLEDIAESAKRSTGLAAATPPASPLAASPPAKPVAAEVVATPAASAASPASAASSANAAVAAIAPSSAVAPPTAAAAAAASAPPTAADVAAAPQQPPPVAPPSTPATTAEMKAVAGEAVAATEAITSKPVPTPPTGPIIPGTAIAALRRISARVRPPTAPMAPFGARGRAARVVVPVDVTVELADGRRVLAVVRDLSATGLYVVVAGTLAIGDEVRCDLGVPGTDGLSISRHRAWARVVRKGDANGYGLELLDPEPDLVDAIRALTASADPAKLR
jgi:hypothetical protein